MIEEKIELWIKQQVLRMKRHEGRRRRRRCVVQREANWSLAGKKVLAGGVHLQRERTRFFDHLYFEDIDDFEQRNHMVINPALRKENGDK